MLEHRKAETSAPEGPPSGGMVSRREIAELAEVTRPTITVWGTRHADFPAPTRSEGMDYFTMSDVLRWLDRRPIAAADRLAGEIKGATYGQRVRRKLAAAQVHHLSRGGFEDEAEAEASRVVEDLLGPLSLKVRGAGGSQADYLWLLLVLVFVRRCAPACWDRIQRAVNEANRREPQPLLRTLGEIGDQALRGARLVAGIAQTFERLKPATAKDVVQVVRLCAGLGSGGFRALLDRFEAGSRPDSADLFTPRGVAELVAQMVMDGVHHSDDDLGTVRIHDPYLRGGELLIAAAEAARERQVTLHGQAPRQHALRLAGMNLAMHGRTAMLRSGTLTPWDEPSRQHDLVLTNPPFGQRNNRAWIEHIVGSLAPNGRAAIVMPNHAGVSTSERALRKYIVDRGSLECVLALPPQLFQTTPIAVTVWFLRPARESGRDVLFIDAGRMGVKERNRRRVLPDHERRWIREALRAWRAGDGPLKGVAVADPSEHDYSLLASDYVECEDVRGNARPAPDQAALEVARPLAATDRFDKADGNVATLVATLKVTPRAGNTEGIPPGWRTVLLRDLCELQPGPTHTRISSAERSAGGARLVVPKHLRDRRVHATDAEELAPADVEKLKKYLLRPGDILCVRSGSPGPSALVEDAQRNWLFGTNLMRLRPKKGRNVDPDFLVAFLSSPDIVSWIKNRSRAAGVIASISGASLGQLPVTVPPIGEQRRIGSAIAALDRQIRAHRDFVLDAERARMSLAAHLLTGTLTCE